MGIADRIWGQELQEKTPGQFKSELQVLIRDLSTINSACKILVFGSVANRSATTSSDLDIAVLLPDSVDRKQFRSQFYKSRTPLPIPVDFIFRNESEFLQQQNDNLIIQEITRTGIEIYPNWRLDD